MQEINNYQEVYLLKRQITGFTSDTVRVEKLSGGQSMCVPTACFISMTCASSVANIRETVSELAVDFDFRYWDDAKQDIVRLRLQHDIDTAAKEWLGLQILYKFMSTQIQDADWLLQRSPDD